MPLNSFYFALLGVLLYNSSFAVVFKFTNVVCESYNQSWFQFHECRLKAVARNRVLMNINGTLLHPVNKALTQGKLFKRLNGYKPWLVDVEVDSCRFMRKRYCPQAKIIYSLFEEFTNINHTCPYVGPMYVKGFYLKPEVLRLPFPTGDYMLSLRWFFNHKLQFDTNVSFVFVEDLRNS